MPSMLLLLLLLLSSLLLLLSVSSTAPFWRAYVSGPLGVLSVRPRPLHGDPGAVLRDGGEDDPTSLTPRSSAAPCSPRRSSASGAPSIPIPSARDERSPTRSSWRPLSSDTPIPQFYLRLLSVDPTPPVALDAFFTMRFTRPSATNDWTCYAVRALENAAATRGMGGSSADPAPRGSVVGEPVPRGRWLRGVAGRPAAWDCSGGHPRSCQGLRRFTPVPFTPPLFRRGMPLVAPPFIRHPHPSVLPPTFIGRPDSSRCSGRILYHAVHPP